MATACSLGLITAGGSAQNIQFVLGQSSIVGNGTAGYTGDGGPATAATLNAPQGAAFDNAGNLFIADTKNNVVRRVDAVTGVITTVAGSGTAGTGCADGTPALTCAIGQPYAVAIDATGNLYVSDPNNNVIRKVDKTGNIAKFAGTGTQGKTGNNGPALAATLYFPTDLQMDAAGSFLYFADSKNGEIRRVNFATNTLTLVAGTGIAGYTADGIQATASELNTTYGFALDPAGNVYIADTKNYRIRRVDAVSGIITTVAGNGTVGTSPGTTLPAPNNGNGGPATSAQFVFAQRLTVDPAGNLLIADSNDYQIRKVDLTTGIISQYAGVGIAGSYAATSPVTTGYTKTPLGIFQDAAGNVYYAETGNNVIRKISAGGRFPATALGTSSASQPLYASLNVTDTPSALAAPAALTDFSVGPTTGCTTGAPNPAGTVCTANVTFTPIFPGLRSTPIVISDPSSTFVAGVSGVGTGGLAAVQPGSMSTVAGGATAGASGDGAAATTALLNAPGGVAINSAGGIYLADTANNEIRFINPVSGTITTLAGTGAAGGTGDGGAATAALLSAPGGVAYDPAGNVYIADTANNRIREIAFGTGLISTIAGTGTAGFSGDSGLATAAQLSAPAAVTVDISGNILLADTGNHRIRRINAQTGIITTLAGTGTPAYAGDGAAAIAAQLNSPSGVFADPSGTLYIADSKNNVVRSIDTAGIIRTVAGTGIAGYTGDGGAATAATLNNPVGAATDAAGNLYISTKGSNAVRVVVAGIINTLAGTGTAAFAGDGGPSTQAAIAAPGGLALDGLGRLLLADTGNNRLRRIDAVNGALIFASQIVQTTSSARTSTVVNAGNAPVSLTSLTVTGPFAIAATGTCSATTVLAPAARCTVDVTFTPTLAGTATGTVTIGTSGAGSSKTIALTGTGQPAQTNGPQTITFNTLPDVPYGTASVALTASSSSGLAVSYSVTGPATLAGSTLTLTGTGTVSVTASQPGNSSYAAATPVTRTFKVTPGVLTVKANSQSTAYGAAIPALTYTVTGFAANDTFATAVTGAPSLSTTALANSLPGVYPITVAAGTLAAANYTFAFTSGTLAISKLASITTLVAPPPNVLSTQTFTLTATVAGSAGATPGGTVTFTSGSVTLGSGTLANGTASAQVSALAPGTYGVVATYSGDTIYTSSSSGSASIVSALPPDYSITASPTAITIPRGQAGLITLLIAPVSGYTGSLTLTCGTLPANVQCSFSPSVLGLNSATTSLQSQLLITTTGVSTGGLALQSLDRGGAVLLLLALLPLALLPARRRPFTRMLIVLCAVGIVSITGCGVRGATASPGTFNVTITAADTVSGTTHSTTVSVTVQ